MNSGRTKREAFQSLLWVSSCVAAVASIALGTLVVVGWMTGNRSLVQVLPSFVPMQFNTALGFFVCGIGLLVLLLQRPMWAGVAGAVSMLIGGLTLVEYIFGVNLGIDELFMKHDITVKTSHPGRMAPNTAICFVLTGAALALGSKHFGIIRRFWVAVLLSSFAFGLSVVAFAGYFTELETAYGWGNLTRMAVHTSVGFVILSVGILFLVWSDDLTDRNWVPEWMPVPTAIAILTATLCLWQALSSAADRITRQYEELSGLSNLATLMLIGGVSLALAVALAVFLAQKAGQRAYDLYRTNKTLVNEVKVRKQAETELAAHRDNLEQQVMERTQELEKASRRAEAANRAKSDFLSHMSHELRTPLNGILGYAQILQRDRNSTDSQRGSVQAILTCGGHLLSLINDVLDLSKIEAGKIEIESRPCDLNKIVRSVMEIVEPRAKSKGLRFDVEIADELPRVIVSDAAKLRQILINLAGNAVKFTKTGSVIVRALQIKSDKLTFEVEDTGIGMSQAELEVVFDAFRQVDGGKDEGGTGLGLAISKRLAESLGGQLKVTSEQGKGSVFTVDVPLVEASQEQVGELTSEDSVVSCPVRLVDGESCTILIADDRPTNRHVLQTLLEDAGFRVLHAEDGEQAVAMVHEHEEIKAVLMDIRMPKLTGLQALAKIRSDARFSELKIIAVTASVFPESRKKALASGFDDFLGKPFQADDLMRKLNKHLNVDFEMRDNDRATLVDEIAPEQNDTVPAEMVSRLESALKIKNLTAIKQLAAEMIGSAESRKIGEEIRDLAAAFDFRRLSQLVENAKEING